MSSHTPTGWRDKEDCAFGNGWQSRAALASRSVMTEDEVIAEFRAADALLEAHFLLSSALRSPRYIQCARVLLEPRRAERRGGEIDPKCVVCGNGVSLVEVHRGSRKYKQ